MSAKKVYDKKLTYGRQFIDDEDVAFVEKVLRSDILTRGPVVDQFEEAIAKYCGAKYAVLYSNGTAALHGAYFAAGIGSMTGGSANDKLLTTPMTFAATSNAAFYCGAGVEFADVDMNGNIDMKTASMYASKQTKAITPVHFGGLPVDMHAVRAFADERELVVIEDACHALGATYKGEKIGNCWLSDMAVFSFHPVKHITTGEGGAVLTNSDEYYYKLKTFRTHGIVSDNFLNESHGRHYMEMQFLGYNYRLSDINAALGLSQLRKIDKFVARRREIAKIYDEAFKDNEFFYTQQPSDDSISSYHLYPIILNDGINRRTVMEKLAERNLHLQVHYIPVYMHPYYRQHGFADVKRRNAEAFYQGEISLPMYYSLTNEDINFVIETLIEVVKDVAR